VLFNSYEYLIYFLPVAVLGFFGFGRHPRWAVRWLVVASLLFYGWWNPGHLPLIAASTIGNFWFAKRIQRAPPSGRWLVAGVAANLALLGVFKYADFILRTLEQAGLVPLVQLDLALPLGISFFTFTQIAFLVDVRRDRAVEPSFDNYALFVTFFPHLLAGPIIHHSEMMPQFSSATNKRVAWDNVAAGVFLLAIGLAKKVFLADPLVPLVAAGFDHATTIGFWEAWFSALAYTLQIYFDFSGYTDMALGAALIFNIRLPINFDSPYRSLDLREFWHRWHITLSRFLREYVYIPLGGNRVRESRVLANLLMTFLLGGLWHGAAWTFFCWGALHGLGLCCLRVWRRSGHRLPPWAAWAVTFVFIVVTWVFFRAHSLGDAWAIVRAMAGLAPAQADAAAAHAGAWGAIVRLVSTNTAATLSLLAGLALVFRRRNSNVLVREMSASWLLALTTAAALTVSILQLGNVAPFLYFNF
jgi:D-alanyl-lipoteichoic acid acyltransferase DltB (MBOAT superfamily)